MSKLEVDASRRREQDILDRLENVKRLIQMENTLMTVEGASYWKHYYPVDKEGKRIGLYISNDLLHSVREEIELQLLSVLALCRGDNPDIGEPAPMLEWVRDEFNGYDVFYETWDKCLSWNA